MSELARIGEITLKGVKRGEGAPLLLLHGLGGLAPALDLVDRLAARFEVIAPEHPGWGAEQPPAQFDSIQDLAELYNELLASMDEPAVVLGLSCGGWVAAEMACLCQHHIAALVLVSPVGIKVGSANEREFVDLWEADPAHLLHVLHGGAERIARPVENWDDEDFLRVARGMEAAARYCWSPYMHSPKLAARLRRVAVPALLLSGEADQFALKQGYYRRYAASIGGGATHETLSDVGHLIEEQAPDQLADHIVGFAASAQGSDSELASRG